MGDINEFCAQVNLKLLAQSELNAYVQDNELSNRVEIVSRDVVLFDATVENAFKAGAETYAKAAKNILEAFEKGYRFAANTIILGFNSIVERM